MEATRSGYCTRLTSEGQPCRIRARPGRPYCFVHDPELTELHREASARGGRNRGTLARATKALPNDLQGVLHRLQAAFAEVLDGSLPPPRAQAAAQVARAIVVLQQAGELELRLREIEDQISRNGGGGETAWLEP